MGTCRSKYFLLFTGLLILLASCGTTRRSSSDYRALAKASVRLGVDIDRRDTHPLYLEASEWMGVRYRSGGNTKNGVDCSGLTCQIYRKVYNKNLERSAAGQMNRNCRKIGKHRLKEGDLVFFTTANSGKKAGHVGIYLKKGKFIHASTSKGVIVSNLNEAYYRKHWLQGGRVK